MHMCLSVWTLSDAHCVHAVILKHQPVTWLAHMHAWYTCMHGTCACAWNSHEAEPSWALQARWHSTGSRRAVASAASMPSMHKRQQQAAQKHTDATGHKRDFSEGMCLHLPLCTIVWAVSLKAHRTSSCQVPPMRVTMLTTSTLDQPGAVAKLYSVRICVHCRSTKSIHALKPL